MPNKKPNYINYKCKVLKQIGLTDTDTLKAYLKRETAGIKNETQKEIRIDNLCRTLITDFYNGDRTFCS